MDRYEWAALNFAENASDIEWMCLARLYLDNFHTQLALWMAHQRRCPEAVALALYWYSSPAACLEYRREGQIATYHAQQYAVFETVERYFGTGFYQVSSLGFDPSHDVNGPDTPFDWLKTLPDRNPEGLPRLSGAVAGSFVNVRELLEDWVEGLPPHIAVDVFNLS